MSTTPIANGSGGANNAPKGPSGGHVRIANWIIRHYLPIVGPVAFGVYVVLKMFADNITGICYPSIARLAKLTGITRRAAQQNIKKLVSERMIEVDKSKGGRGRHSTNQFRILPLVPQKKDEPNDSLKRVSANETTRLSANETTRLSANETTHELTLFELTPGELSPEREAAAPPAPDHELLSWLTWWNGLKARGLVSAGVNAHPSEDVQAGWKRVQKSRKLRELLGDRPAIEKAIEASDFIQGAGWFTLAALFGGKNKLKAFYIENLLNGGYTDGNGNGKRGALVGEGQRHASDRQRAGF